MSKMDPGSNYTIAEGLSALSRGADTHYTDAVDHANGDCAAFAISCGTFDTSFVATVQTSSDNSTWEDQTDDGSGNDVSAELEEAGSAVLDVPNPLARYSRLKLVLGGTCVCGVTSILGPLLNKVPDAAA